MSKYCSHGNLLHFGLQCSQLNIRYYNQDLHWVRDPAQLTLQAFDSRPTPTYTALASTKLFMGYTNVPAYHGWFV